MDLDTGQHQPLGGGWTNPFEKALVTVRLGSFPQGGHFKKTYGLQLPRLGMGCAWMWVVLRIFDIINRWLTYPVTSSRHVWIRKHAWNYYQSTHKPLYQISRKQQPSLLCFLLVLFHHHGHVSKQSTTVAHFFNYLIFQSYPQHPSTL